LKLKNIDSDNRELKELIISIVINHLKCEVHSVEIIEIVSYNWSYIIWLRVNDGSERKKYVIKIPKLKINQHILDAISNRRNLIKARSEFSCLERVKNKVSGIKGISVVETIFLLPTINAFMLEEIKGDKLFELIKEKRLTTEKIAALLYRIGLFLRCCHCVYGVSTKRTCLSWESFSDKNVSDFENKIMSSYSDSDRIIDIDFTTMLLGFEIRNIFYCTETDQITIHDLQEVNDKPVYEDVSQFLVSLDLVNWGKYYPQRLPLICYKEFIHGYFGGKELDVKVLSYYIINEYLRFYNNAHEMLDTKYGIKILRSFIMKIYHERWITKWISSKYWKQLRV